MSNERYYICTRPDEPELYVDITLASLNYFNKKTTVDSSSYHSIRAGTWIFAPSYFKDPSLGKIELFNDDHSELSKISSIRQFYKRQQYTEKHERIVCPTMRFDTIITTATGLKPLVLSSFLRNKKSSLVVMYDQKYSCIDWQRLVINEWAGQDYSHFLSSHYDEIKKLKSHIPTAHAAFREAWNNATKHISIENFKHQLHMFIEFDLLLDDISSLTTLAKGTTLIDVSNTFSTPLSIFDCGSMNNVEKRFNNVLESFPESTFVLGVSPTMIPIHYLPISSLLSRP